MTFKFILSTGMLCLLASTALYAQKKVYSLEDLWLKALDYYPSITARKSLVEQKEFEKELIKKERLPAINLQAQQSYGAIQGIGGSFFSLPGIYNSSAGKPIDDQPGAASNLYVSTVLQWDIIQFGKLQKKINEASAGLAVNNASLQSEEIKLRELSTRYYFQLLQANALLGIAQLDSARLEQLYQLSKAQAEAGLRPGADTMLLKAGLLQAGGNINEQQGLFETAQLQLSALVGEHPFNLTVDTSFYKYPLHFTVTPWPDSISRHPYLDFLKAKVEKAKASLQVVQKDIYPSIGLLAGTGTRGSGLSAPGTVDKSFLAPWQTTAGSYLVGIGLTWNLSKLYKNKLQQKIMQSEVDAAHADYEEALVQLTSSYQSALARWRHQVLKLQGARDAYHASIEAFELYTSRYKNGLVSMIEILQLQKTLQEAERYYIQTIAGYWNERINQSVSTGDFTSLLREINP